MNLDVAGLTDIGKRRKKNEDGFRIVSVPPWTLCIVADGMGGHVGGDVASSLAIDGADSGFRAQGSLTDRLARAVAAANVAVWTEAERQEKLLGMGTTLVCLAIGPDGFQVAHVGDSRAYYFTGSEIRQVTTDHSWVGEQVAAGTMTEEAASKHPYRGAITRCVGCQPTVTPDISPLAAFPPEAAIVLCSDGLTNHLSDEDIQQLALEGPSISAAQKMIDLANERGGVDNITVIVLRSAPVS